MCFRRKLDPFLTNHQLRIDTGSSGLPEWSPSDARLAKLDGLERILAKDFDGSLVDKV